MIITTTGSYDQNYSLLNDYTNTLTTEQKVQLNTELTEYEKKTGNNN